MIMFVLASDLPLATEFSIKIFNLPVSTEFFPIQFNRHSIHTSIFISFVTNGVDALAIKNNEIIAKDSVEIMQMYNNSRLYDADTPDLKYLP